MSTVVDVTLRLSPRSIRLGEPMKTTHYLRSLTQIALGIVLVFTLSSCVVPVQNQPAPSSPGQPQTTPPPAQSTYPTPPVPPPPPPTTQPPPVQPVPPPRPRWNNKGWTFLGRKQVNGSRDRDRIVIDSNLGRFNALTIVGRDADIYMDDISVVFYNTRKFQPNLRHRFVANSRTRRIDLPGQYRRIRHLTFRYGNLARGRQATVEIWGKAAPSTDPQPPVIRPQPPRWNSREWTKLGEKWINGRRNNDVLYLSGNGAFTKVTIVVSEADLEVSDLRFTFGNRETFSPQFRQVFRNGSRSRLINLPGRESNRRRNLRQLAFRYRTLTTRGRAKVAVWAKSDIPPPQKPQWNPRGWTKLGEKWVNGRRDKDAFSLSNRGTFTHLMVVVSESDLRMFDMKMRFGNGEKYSPNLAHLFKNGDRSKPISLPGFARTIRQVKFKYGNLPGNGRAKVALYGINRNPAPVPPRWNPQGWIKLGEKRVNGTRDHDSLRIGHHRGMFSHLAIVVSESDLRMDNIVVTFGNRQQFSPRLRHMFKNGSRSRKINLPGEVRNLSRIEFSYGNIAGNAGNGRARVEIWGKPGPVNRPPPVGWNPRGWSKLGSRTVTGNRRHRPDKDRITVRGDEKWRFLTLQVTGSDLELFSVVVTFKNGSQYAPQIRHFFKQGGMTRQINLPGARKIKHIDFTYGNVPGGGRAVMNVWAR